MKKITTKTKDNNTVYLCAKCQLELEEDDAVCSNCGTEYSTIAADDWALEPINAQEQENEEIEPDEAFEDINYPQNKKGQFSRKRAVLALSLVTIISAYTFSNEILNLVSAPFLERATKESQSLQNALTKFREQNAQWPETLGKLQYFQHITENRNSDFILTGNGDYQQILNNPFYLKGKVINWRKSGNIWRCHSKELSQLNLKLPCSK